MRQSKSNTRGECEGRLYQGLWAGSGLALPTPVLPGPRGLPLMGLPGHPSLWAQAGSLSRWEVWEEPPPLANACGTICSGLSGARPAPPGLSGRCPNARRAHLG